MVPLDAARVADLGPGDFVKVECTSCRHDEMIPHIGFTEGLRLPQRTRILDLESRFRCRECDERGKAVLSIKWAG